MANTDRVALEHIWVCERVKAKKKKRVLSTKIKRGYQVARVEKCSLAYNYVCRQEDDPPAMTLWFVDGYLSPVAFFMFLFNGLYRPLAARETFPAV